MSAEEYDILSRPSPEIARRAIEHVWSYLRSDGDLRSYKSFDVKRLAERGWVAVPVAHYPEEPQIERLATHARKTGVASAIAVVTRSNEDVFVVSFETDVDLWNVSAQSYLRAIAVVVEEADFALLYEGSYFSVLAGPQALLESVLDKPLEVVREDFRTYVSGLVNDGAAFRAWLLDEEERYAAASN